MKPRRQKITAAFSLPELLIVVAIVATLAAIVLPDFARKKNQANRVKCVGNQKNIGTAFRVFASDNGDSYPLQTTTNAYIYPPGGVGTLPGAVVSTNAQAWQVFQCMWNELQTPKVLLCPSDRARSTYNRTTDFNGLARAPGSITTASLAHPGNQNQAVSYTTVANADEARPLQVLITDRNINLATTNTAAAIRPLPSGTRFAVASAATASSMFWVGRSSGSFHGLEGNFSFADGSVQQATAKVLQDALVNAGTAYGWGTPTNSAPGVSEFLLP